MKLYVDLDSFAVIEGPSFRNPLTSVQLKRGDSCQIDVQFARAGVVVELDSLASGVLGIKTFGDYDGAFLCLSESWVKTGTGTATTYTFDLDLDTLALAAVLTGDTASVTAMLEIEVTIGTTSFSTSTLKTYISNDVIQGGEGNPLLAGALVITTVGDARFPLMMPQCRSLSVNDGSGTGTAERLGKCVDSAIAMTGLATATLTGSGLTDLSSITFNDLQGCGAITFATWPALATIAFPELVYCGAIDIRPNTATLTALTFPKLKYLLGSLTLTSDSGLVTLAFPELLYCSNNFGLSTLANLTTLSLPKLKKVFGAFSPVTMAKLTTLSTPELTHVNGNYAPSTMALLTTLGAAKLAYVFGNYAPDTMVKLETLACPLLVHVGGNFAPATIGTSGTKTLKLSFPELKTIVGNFAPATNNSRLSSYSFPKLETVAGSFTPHLPYISATLANPCAAADDIIDTTTDHPFQVGDYIKFTALTGGSGLTVNTVYKVHANNFAARTFQVADVTTGAVVGFTTNITAGTVCIAQRVVFEKLTTVSGVITLAGSSSGAGTSFAEIDFPEILDLAISTLSNCTGITKLSAPKATYVSLTGSSALTNLTAMAFPLAQSFSCSGFSSSGIVSLDLPSLTSPNGIDLSGCYSLASVNFGSNLWGTSADIRFYTCALTSTSIRHILDRCASYPGSWGGYTIDLSGGNNRGYDDWYTDLGLTIQTEMYTNVMTLRGYGASVYINQEPY